MAITNGRGYNMAGNDPLLATHEDPETPMGKLGGRETAFQQLISCSVALDALAVQFRRCLMLNTNEYRSLAYLWRTGTISMSELATGMGMSRAAITALIDRLERLGYVTRTADAYDRRRMLVSLTARSAQVLKPFTSVQAKKLCDLAAALDDNQWQAVEWFIDKVSASAVEQAAQLHALDDDELFDLIDAARGQ